MFAVRAQEDCCVRCTVQPSFGRCCDSCNPEFFPFLSPPSPLPKLPRSKRKFKFEDYKMNSSDFKLRDGLDNWRTSQMETEFPGDDFFGPQYIMSDDILNRIVDLAHHGKLLDISSLLEQTDWKHAVKYGFEILELVNMIHTPPLPPLAPVLSLAPSTSSSRPALQDILNPLSQINRSNPQPGARKPRHCTACGAENHICKCLLAYSY